MPNGLIYLNLLDRCISSGRDVLFVYIITIFIEIAVFNANNVDLDQTRQNALSGQNRVWTVCQCPFNGTLGVNVLKEYIHFQER